MSKRVGIGIIGTGFARRVQTPAFLACEDAFIASVASGTLEHARAAADEAGAEHFTDDWRETVARDDVDLVCITTPPVMHRDMVLASALAGKHILCEKPMAMNVAEAEEMTAATRDTGKLALIDHELRFQDGRQQAFELIRDGKIGKIRHAKVLFQAPHRGDPSVPWNWWSDIASGGGALGAIGSHIIDSFIWLLGTDIASISCQLATQVKQRRTKDGELRDVTSDDEANMLLKFAESEWTNDATGIVSLSMTEGPTYRNRLELFGDKGTIRLSGRGALSIAATGESEWTKIDVDLGEEIEGVPDTGFSRAFMKFAPKIVSAVREGASSIDGAATFEDGVRVQRVLDAARESDASGRRIEL